MIPASPAIAHCWLERIGLLQWFLYDDSIGVVPAAHFHKICSRRGCSFCQYYGYYTTGSTSSCQAMYNSDWQSLPYFVSSKETAFSTELLRRLDVEIVIGQMSYKQRADIYNYVHCNTSAWQLYLQRKLIKLAQTYVIYFLCQKNIFYTCI